MIIFLLFISCISDPYNNRSKEFDKGNMDISHDSVTVLFTNNIAIAKPEDAYVYWSISNTDQYGNSTTVIPSNKSTSYKIPVQIKTVISISKSLLFNESILVYPGDSIIVNNDSENVSIQKRCYEMNCGMFKESEFTQRFLSQYKEMYGNLDRLHELIFTKKLYGNYASSLVPKTNVSKVTVDETKEKIKQAFSQIYLTEQGLLKILLSKKEINKDYYDWMSIHIINTYFGRLRSIVPNEWHLFYTLAQKYHFINDLNFSPYNNEYRSFLEMHYSSAVIAKNKVKKIKNQFTLDYPMVFDSASQYLTGKSLDYLRLACLRNIRSNESITVFNKYLKKFNENVTEKDYLSYVRNNMNFYATQQGSEGDMLLTASKNQISIKQLLSYNQGSVLYVDLWASWCVPCRVEMPASNELKKYYKTKKFKVIYISIDDDYQKWSIATKQELLDTAENSYLLINPRNSKMVRNLKIESIPRYLLFDEMGKIVHTNAPQSSDPELKKLIQKYIE